MALDEKCLDHQSSYVRIYAGGSRSSEVFDQTSAAVIFLDRLKLPQCNKRPANTCEVGNGSYFGLLFTVFSASVLLSIS